ncbi:hypothetical protein AAES_147344 [Amazona aestiva]|uniref:Uncharacterized protein n=1 Tax=Amazona aestiva TaxID=12930 RepID=A0A0Q3LXY1_AMAAE|nr:hypothetical protein AAES_147344 [Amazona aestiva]
MRGDREVQSQNIYRRGWMISQSLECESFCQLHCQLWLSNWPGLYPRSVVGNTKEQGFGWPKSKDVAKDMKQGSDRAPKGTEVHGEQDSRGVTLGGLIMAMIIGSLAIDIAVD